jgi:hypothetical protein
MIASCVAQCSTLKVCVGFDLFTDRYLLRGFNLFRFDVLVKRCGSSVHITHTNILLTLCEAFVPFDYLQK